MQDYHDLLVWKKAMEFTKLAYKLSALFPKIEMFGLTGQFRRAAISIAANIVEGRGKNSDKDFLRYLFISKGSLNECECYLELAYELQYINETQFIFMKKKKGEVGFLLFKLIQTLK